MTSKIIRLLGATLLLTLGASGCAHSRTAASAPSRSPDDRPYNSQKGQFEDPTPPKHRTSPGDAAR